MTERLRARPHYGRRCENAVNEVPGGLRLEKHPDKTFIGRIERGFDFLGFPEERLKPYEIDAQQPDEFLVPLLDLSAGNVCGAVQTHTA